MIAVHWPLGRAAVIVILATMAAAAAEPELNEADLPRFPPLETDAARQAFVLAPGLAMEVVAAEPDIVDPIALSFDATGAMYVVEMRDYSERRAERLSRIKRLVDRDGDGRFESATVFLDDLAWATGVVCARDGIFVAASPDILFARDTDGDGMADERKVVMTGFGEGRARLNVQALVNSLTIGPDNRIWGATAGNGGQVDGVRLDGADFSFDPMSFSLRPESGTAQYGLTFDAYGRRFVCSNSHHLQWVAIDRHHLENALARSSHPLVDIPVDGPAAEVFRLSPEEPWRVIRTHWRASGVVEGLVEGGGRASGYFTSASGLAVYTGDLMPALAGQVFVGDVGSNLVHRKSLRETDDGPVAERDRSEKNSEFLASRDTWFRPVACANGPDGALYIVDMYREVVEHPDSLPPNLKQRLDLNSGNDRGRIYRIVPEMDTPRRHTQLASLAPEALAALTNHPNGWHRSTARRLLVERQAAAAVPVLRSLTTIDALATLDGLHAVNIDDLRRALTATDPHTAIFGLRLLEKQPGLASALERELSSLCTHSSTAVRRQWALTLGQVPVPEKIEHLSRTWIHPPSMPRLREAVRLALRSPGESLALLKTIPEPDLELVALIGRGTDPKAIADAASWLRITLAGKNELLFTLTLALDDTAAVGHLAKAAHHSLVDPAEPAATRAAAAALLSHHRNPASLAALQQSFFDPTAPEPVRAAAWPAVGPDRAADVWAAWPRLPSPMRTRILDRTVAQKAWHQPLLTAVAAGHIAALELSTAQCQQLRSSPDAAIAALARKSLGPPPPDRQTAIAARLPALRLQGDPVAGETVFRQRCLSCHRHGTEGAEVGPDRITFRNLGKATLLASILDPNREVAPRFLAATVTTTSGETWQGLILRDDSRGIALRLVGGQEIDVPREAITSFDRLARSLMPEGLETGLSDPELASLLEFLIR